MRDIEKRNPGVLQRAYPVEQTDDLFSLKFGCGLVENDEPAALQKRARDLDDLTLLDREPPGFQIGRDRQIPIFKCGDRRFLETPPVHESERVQRLIVEKEVFRDGQMGQHHPALVDAGDAVAPGFAIAERGRGRARKSQIASIGGMEPGQHSDERRLPRAISSDKRPRVSCGDRDRNVVKHDIGAELFEDAFCLRRVGRLVWHGVEIHPRMLRGKSVPGARTNVSGRLGGLYFAMLPQSDASLALAWVTTVAGSESIRLSPTLTISLPWSVAPGEKVFPSRAAFA